LLATEEVTGEVAARDRCIEGELDSSTDECCRVKNLVPSIDAPLCRTLDLPRIKICSDTAPIKSSGDPIFT